MEVERDVIALARFPKPPNKIINHGFPGAAQPQPKSIFVTEITEETQRSRSKTSLGAPTASSCPGPRFVLGLAPVI